MSTRNNSSSHIGKLPVAELDSGAGGDCFYFTIYDALVERGLLNDFVKSIGLTYARHYGVIPKFTNNKKQNFNRYLRTLVASRINQSIINNALTLLDDMNEFKELLKSNSRNSDEYTSIIHDLSNKTDLSIWFIKDYINYRKKNLNESLHDSRFYVLVKKTVETPGNEAQQIEISITREILESVGIIMKNVLKEYPRKKGISQYSIAGLDLNSDEKRIIAKDDDANKPDYTLNGYGGFSHKKLKNIKLLPESPNGEPIIYIVNSPQEGHFTFFSFSHAKYSGGKKGKKTHKKKNAVRIKYSKKNRKY